MARGYSGWPVRVQVKERDQVVTLGVRLNPIADERPVSVPGQIENFSAEAGCDVVRLVPVALFTAPNEALVSRAGRFVLEHVETGRYVALWLGNGKVCSTELVVLSKFRSSPLQLGRGR